MPLTASLVDDLRRLLASDAVIASEAALFTYEADALASDRHPPDVVVLPRDTGEVAAVVRWAAAHGLPVVARGAGTGLAGGATCEQGGIALSLNRMDRVLRVDAERHLAWVQPGVVNLALSRATAAHALHFAPDPASQQVSTVGGNAATNAGGPHCLKHGVTFNHLLALTVVLADGEVVTLGGEAADAPGRDLLAVVCGSEGTTAIITELCVRLTPDAEAVRTLLLDFDSVAAACDTVSRIIASGVVPAAMEIMDRPTVALVEAWLGLGLPLDAAAVLLLEVDGPAVALEAQVARCTEVARTHGVRRVRVARDAAERAALWKGRKSAFGAYGRLRKGFHIMDGVVPRTRLAEALERLVAMAEARGLEAGNVFHAGDGNLHPHVLFDPAVPGQAEAALEVSHGILRMCIAMGGTISGEHGVGIEKRPMMAELFAPDDLAVMERVRAAFDPDRRLNPGKVMPGGGGCGEVRHGGSHERIAAIIGAPDREGPWI
jgi:glycolate oxidase